MRMSREGGIGQLARKVTDQYIFTVVGRSRKFAPTRRTVTQRVGPSAMPPRILLLPSPLMSKEEHVSLHVHFLGAAAP